MSKYKLLLCWLCLLVSGCQSRQEKLNERLIEAIRHWEYDEVWAALSEGADPNAISDSDRRDIGMQKGQTILLWTLATGRTGMAEILARQGADLKALDSNGISAFAHLVRSARLETVRGVLERDSGALARRVTGPSGIEGNVVLAEAVARTQLDLARLLLRHGARYGVRLNSGMLLEAAEHWRPEGIRFLLENKVAHKDPELLRRALAVAGQSWQRSRTMVGSDYESRYRETMLLLREALAKESRPTAHK